MSNNPTRLSDQELIDRLVETFGDGGLFPTAEQWRGLLSSDHTGPIVDVNLFRLRERAYDPDQPELDMSGLEAFVEYGKAMGPVLKRFDGKVLSNGRIFLNLVGSDAERWDIAASGQYPSIRRYMSMALDPAYQKAQRFKIAAVEATRIYTVIAFPG